MMDAILAAGIRLVAGVHVQHQLAHPLSEVSADAFPDRVGRIYFANHTSNLDFLVIWAALPRVMRRRARPVAAADYWQSGWVRPFLARRIFRAVLIARREVNRANNPLELMARALEEGADLILFPEGTRSRSGVMQAFKGGLYHLAKAFPAVELMPVGLENLNRILPAGEFLPVPVMARIRVGEAVPPLAAEETRAAFLERCQSAVAELVSPHGTEISQQSIKQ